MAKTKSKYGRNSFWCQIVKQSGYRVDNLDDCHLGIDQPRLHRFLTGESMPPRNIALKLCEFFNVKQNTGLMEFRKAHKAWKNAQMKPQVKKALGTIIEMPKLITTPIPTLPKLIDSSSVIVSSDMLHDLYGKLPYDEYMLFRGGNLPIPDILSSVYSKVDFDTYMELRSYLRP